MCLPLEWAACLSVGNSWRIWSQDESEKFELAAKNHCLHFLPLCRCFSSHYILQYATVALYITVPVPVLHTHVTCNLDGMRLFWWNKCASEVSGSGWGVKWGCSGPPLLLGLSGKPQHNGAELGLLTGLLPSPIRMLSMLLCLLYLCTRQPCCQPWSDSLHVYGGVYWPAHKIK